jgi:hypothetical protein
LAVLVLSLAPLASLYLVFFSFLGMDPTTFIVIDGGTGGKWENVAATTVADRLAGTSPVDWKQLAHNRTALEELFKAVYREASQQQTYTFMTWDSTTLSKGLGSPLQQHWTVVLPWLLTFILGVVVPLLLSCWSFFRQTRRRRQGATKQHLKKIVKYLTKFSKVLTRDDQVVHNAMSSDVSSSDSTPDLCQSETSRTTTTTTETDDNSDNEKDVVYWVLPPPGEPLEKHQPECGRHVPGSCVVCLNLFQIGERVAYSPNPKCQHCFHFECIGKWMTRQGECPCCRREWWTSN